METAELSNDATIIRGDCLDVLPTIEANSVDAVITDPPYMIGFMGKDFDKPENNPAANVGMWQEALRVLKPDGHLLSFGGTRTYHRMACAIEDAGFEIRDMCEWITGSGFPKSHNVGKAVDKLQGNEREFIGYGKRNPRDKKSYGGDSVSTFAAGLFSGLSKSFPINPIM